MLEKTGSGAASDEVNDRPWDVVSDKVQLAEWKRALEQNAGNIKRAAKALGIGRATGTRLTSKFELNEFAAKLRIAAGAVELKVGGEIRSIGRPRKR